MLGLPNRQSKVLGVGNPMVDHIVEVSDDFVRGLDGEKGGMEPVTYEQFQEILVNAGSPVIRMVGGSAANTIRALAQMGHSCAFTGKIGTDESARFFLETFYQLQVEPRLSSTTTPTAQVACLVTPDGHRTFRSFFGACGETRAKDLKPLDFADARLVYMEGYALDLEEVAERAMTLAKQAGAKVALGLASFEIVTRHQPFIHQFLERHVDVVFANEEESQALFHLPAHEGCQRLSNYCEVAVVSMGSKGCWVASNGELFHHPAFQVPVVDTIGAGDLFAAGFLHGLLRGKPLTTCAYYGNLCGGAIVQHHGAELPKQVFEDLKAKLLCNEV